jgi:hypothetical protein
MKKFPPRFVVPVDLARPRGARLLEAFSPKLGRPIRHFDHAAFEYWVALEADPGVEVFCERPVRFPAGPGDGTADFWVRGHKGESILLLSSRDAAVVPNEIDGIPVQLVAAAEVAAAGTWVRNRQRMLPVIIAARGSVAPGLAKSILVFERELVKGQKCGDEDLPNDGIVETLVRNPGHVRGCLFVAAGAPHDGSCKDLPVGDHGFPGQ